MINFVPNWVDFYFLRYSNSIFSYYWRISSCRLKSTSMWYSTYHRLLWRRANPWNFNSQNFRYHATKLSHIDCKGFLWYTYNWYSTQKPLNCLRNSISWLFLNNQQCQGKSRDKSWPTNVVSEFVCEFFKKMPIKSSTVNISFRAQ